MRLGLLVKTQKWNFSSFGSAVAVILCQSISRYTHIYQEKNIYTRLKISCMATPFLYSLFLFLSFLFLIPQYILIYRIPLEIIFSKRIKHLLYIFSISFSPNIKIFFFDNFFVIVSNFFKTFDFFHVCHVSGQMELLMKQNIILLFLLIFWQYSDVYKYSLFDVKVPP